MYLVVNVLSYISILSRAFIGKDGVLLMMLNYVQV